MPASTETPAKPVSTEGKAATTAAKRANGKSRTTAKGKSKAEVKATDQHPEARQAILKRCGLSMKSFLEPDQIKRADSAKAKGMKNARALAEFIMKGAPKSAGNGRSSSSEAPISTPRRTGPRPDGKLTGLDAARKVVKSNNRKGITPPDAARAMLALDPPPITGKYAQANAQKKVYDLIKAGEFTKDENGKVHLAKK